ncbi:MAG TPA: tetratricopeptide repeat protein [Terriglobales bacterium]|nr:tetratricopeptide repeat protein [Terriglobales bacterium]
MTSLTAQSKAPSASTLLDRAEGLLAKGDYTGAEPLLQQATSKDPKSYQAWYDLGFAEEALNKNVDAIAAFRKSVGINAKVFESNYHLGLALASTGQNNEEAISFLKAATQLTPQSHPSEAKERAWIALGELQQSSKPTEAEQSFAEAAKLIPADPKPLLLSAALLENEGKLDEASQQYRQALSTAQGEQRAQALRGMVNTAIAAKQYDEAEKDVRQYLAVDSSDRQAHLLLGRLLAAQGKNADALTELQQAGDANDAGVQLEKAQLLTELNRVLEALPLYEQLVQRSPNDAQLHYQYGLALMKQHQFPAAEQQLLAAVQRNPNLANAYGDLAIAASDDQHYDLALKALEVRTKLLGDNPGTYFLRATALDHLRRYPEATQNYRQFLAVANGKFPDQEWQARHRLVAIEKMK